MCTILVVGLSRTSPQAPCALPPHEGAMWAPDSSGGADPSMHECAREDFIRLQLERPLSASFRPPLISSCRSWRGWPCRVLQIVSVSDSLEERFGSLDWKDRKFASEDASPYLAQLPAVTGWVYRMHIKMHIKCIF